MTSVGRGDWVRVYQGTKVTIAIAVNYTDFVIGPKGRKT